MLVLKPLGSREFKVTEPCICWYSSEINLLAIRETSWKLLPDINKLVSDYQNLSLDYLDNTYHTLRQVLTPNSFTFDDSGGRDSDETATPDFSNTLETMDNEIFTRYGSDSSF